MGSGIAVWTRCERHVYAFPFNSTCQFAALATVGGNPSSVWVNGNTNTGILAHEFGHTLGLYHSHAFNCHPTVVTPPCSPVEYGDTTDTMGGGFGHSNAFQKQRGWLDFGASPPSLPPLRGMNGNESRPRGPRRP